MKGKLVVLLLIAILTGCNKKQEKIETSYYKWEYTEDLSYSYCLSNRFFLNNSSDYDSMVLTLNNEGVILIDIINETNADFSLIENVDTNIIELNEIGYLLLDIYNDEVNKRELVILYDDIKQNTVFLCTGEDYMGFSVNWIKEIQNGFELSIELGKYYYERNFQFVMIDSSFYLKSIQTKSIDYSNDNRGLEELIQLEDPIHINGFRLEDYLFKL